MMLEIFPNRQLITALLPAVMSSRTPFHNSSIGLVPTQHNSADFPPSKRQELVPGDDSRPCRNTTIPKTIVPGQQL